MSIAEIKSEAGQGIPEKLAEQLAGQLAVQQAAHRRDGTPQPGSAPGPTGPYWGHG